MFKALRDRLRGVSRQLEEELESQLADQVDAELAKEIAAEVSREPPSEEATEPDAAPGPESGPGAAPGSEDLPARPEMLEPEPAEGPEPETVTAAAPPDVRPKPEDEDDEETAAGTMEGTSATTGTATGGAAPTPPAAQEPEASSARERPPRPKAPVTGRKVLTEEEIERRLRQELDAAVDTQRAVEEVAAAPGGARFTINEDVLEEILWELEIALLESDVAVPVVEAIKESVKEQLLALPVQGRPEDIVEKVLRTAVRRVLSVSPLDFDAWLQKRLAAKKPVVVMFVGVNGTGKTTSIARIAHRLKENGISCVMAAGDTFRAGAIEQLALHGERLGVKVVKHAAGADPAAVAYDAIEHAKARRKDVVLLDTAGRMQTNRNLMDEMDKVRRVADPDLVVFVGDSLAGNDAVEQARRFDEVVDIGGAILTKVDVDAKGGAALSVAYTINKPLLFVGVGQDYPDLRPFDAGWLVDRLFGADEALAEAA